MKRNVVLRWAFIFAMLFCSHTALYAQFHETFDNTSFASPVLRDTFIKPAATNFITYTSAGEDSFRLKNIITFSIDENSSRHFYSGFTARVVLTIESKETLADVAVQTTQALVVNYDPAAGAKYNARAWVTLPSAEEVKITVDSIQITGQSGWNPIWVLRLDNEMRTSRYHTLSNNTGYLTPTFTSPVPDSSSLQVGWSWDPNTHNNINQLEWAWVEDEMYSFYSSTDELFADNSTRVDLDIDQQSYKIPLLYDGVGKIYYRVRAAFRRNDGTVITGPWTTATAYSFNGHEPSLNWQSSTSFAENGKLKSVIQYFDGSLRGRQTVTKDNSTNTSVVAETIYDLQGRPNLQILPTPASSTAIKYFKNFNRFNGQASNEDPAKYFDLTPAALKCGTPLALDSAYGNGRYYSANNDWLASETKSKFIPNAQGYAYTETRFMDDATERVSLQGGVGPNHQIGSGHETKYFYGKPSQAELDALFGTEAGDASHYFKNMVQDANGQMSVSYVDMHGRTVATALAGDTTAGIDGIRNDTDYPMAGSAVRNNLLTPSTNIIKDNSIESISSLLAPATTIYDFTYKLDPGIISQLACNSTEICFDCKYDLEISIKGEQCGDTTPIIKKYNNLQIVAANLACGTSMGFTGTGVSTATKQIDFSLTLPPGSYIIRKTLTVNDSMYRVRRDSALKVFLCKTEQQIYDSIYTVLMNQCSQGSGQTACDSCNTKLGTYSQYKTKYLLSIGNPDTYNESEIHYNYTADSLSCAAACNVISPNLATLAGLRKQLLDDMIPYTGQYAIPVDSIASMSQLQAKFNIFTTTYTGGVPPTAPTKPFYKYPKTEAGTASSYYYEEGDVDFTIHPAGVGDNSKLSSIAADDYVPLYQRSWAKSLIYYHPEFTKLQFAEANLRSSYAWLDSLYACETWAQAQTYGFDNPITHDPYFVNNYVPANVTTMTRYISNHTGGTGDTSFPSIWRLANGSMLCMAVEENAKAACMQAKSKTGMEPGTATIMQDSIWLQFRSLYSSYRNDMLVNYITSQSGVLSTTNMATLQSEGKTLAFVNSSQMAAQSPGGGGSTTWTQVLTGDTTGLGAIYTANMPDRCVGQKPFWKARLLQCEQFKVLLNNNNSTDTATVNTIINTILDSLVMVCRNTLTPQQMYGATTSKPGFAGNPKTFEAIVNNVFAANGIATLPNNNYYCNPFSIDFPKPYGKNPPVFTKNATTLDSCNCTRIAVLKTEAKALGYDTLNLTSMNQFLLAHYKDTLLPPVWEGLKKCKDMFYGPCEPLYVVKYNTDGCDTTTWRFWQNASHANGWLRYKDAFVGGVVHVPDSVYTHVTSGISKDSMDAKHFNLDYSHPICDLDSFSVTFRLKDKAFNFTALAGGIILKVGVKSASPNVVYQAYILHDQQGGLYKSGEGFPGIYTTNNLKIKFPDYRTVKMTFASGTLSIYVDSVFKFSRPYTEAITGLYTVAVEFLKTEGYIEEVKVEDSKGKIKFYEDFNRACSTFTTLNKRVYTPIPLSGPVKIPGFLDCGYEKPCITCGKLDSLTAEFRLIYPAYNTTPYRDSTISDSMARRNDLWARFLNYRTGFSKHAQDYLWAYDSCQVKSPKPNPAICSFSVPANDPTGIFQTDSLPCVHVGDQAAYLAELVFAQMKDSLLRRFDSLYKAKCFEAKTREEFYVQYLPKEYHYTLYYYDQAGNLVKTMPPAAVRPQYSSLFLAAVANARAAGTDYTNPGNNEMMTTHYRYNTLNQVIAQKTPDAGTSAFWYDRLGRLVVSQNAKQLAVNTYSYTLYDSLGRITEVGEKPHATAMTQTISQDAAALSSWFTGGSSKTQMTVTVYDTAYGPLYTPEGLSVLNQRNLRNRVSYTFLRDVDNNDAWEVATFYSYDIHGNVDTLLNDYRTGMGTKACISSDPGNHGNRFKKLHYDYDLISGKVNQVSYQDGYHDAFYHRYEYDAENRITAVQTSRDKIYWEQDAEYEYYRHGPLARSVVGALKVQGLDYAYTLQGWLKGVNSSGGADSTTNHDMGGDGFTGTGNHPLVAKDAYGYSLHYYNNDYRSISTTVTPVAGFSLPLAADPVSSIATGTQLYNGNIAAMTVRIPQLEDTRIYGYRYDQLNRIKRMDAFIGAYGSGNIYTPDRTDDYHEEVSYDPNGNILTYLRSGKVKIETEMDKLTYQYERQGSGALASNRLRYVHDQVNSANYSEDIDSQTSLTLSQVNDDKNTSQSSDNFAYDAIGNLIKDTKEGIDSIYWTVYGKISRIRKGSTVIQYKYDAAGNRISKNVDGKITYYVRDASGNVMGVYEAGTGGINGGNLSLKELHLYGSSRLGIQQANINVACLPIITGSIDTFTRGNKFFELSNHLGNVLVIITDRHQGINSDADSLVNYYNADVATANDYYPFGMQMPGRKFTNGNGYRYGFNGKENDNEVKGEGNQQDYGMRIYDPRLGRFLSVDPLTKKFPNLTPYQYAGNKPIWCVDLDGLEDIPTTELNKYGEKQVYQISTDIIDGNTISTFTSNQIPSNAKPVTQNLSDKQIYRLAVARMLVPGQFLISKDQYLDEKYFEAEQRVKYYYSHHATATMSKGPHSDKLTGEIHNIVTNALFSDDNTMSDAAATMIERRTSFFGKFNWAKTAVEFGAGALIASGFKYAIGRLGGALESLGIPKGFNIMADPSRFRVAANNLGEQITMKAAMQGEGTAIMGAGTQKALGDPRLAGMNITKFETSQKFTDKLGNTVTSTVHYLKNNDTGVSFDFKFVTNTY